jgi:hypothetical protein
MALVFVVAGLTSCFESPDVPEGLLCSEEDNCPPDQSCVEGRCYLEGKEPTDGGLTPDATPGFAEEQP